MSGVTSLGYLGLGVKNPDAWEKFATQILGLQSSGIADDGRLLLRMDENAYRFALHRDDADDIAYAGWEVADAAGLRDVAERMRAIGVEAKPASPEEAAARRVTELIRFTDPNGDRHARCSAVRRCSSKIPFIRRARLEVSSPASKASVTSWSRSPTFRRVCASIARVSAFASATPST